MVLKTAARGRQEMTLQHPRPLAPGDRIGIVAPASPFNRDRFERGASVLRRMGFEPVYDASLFRKKGYFAGTAAERAAELREFFLDPQIHGIWCARGGYGSLRLLPKLDYSAVCRNPKVFVGCSDITALLITFYLHCGFPTFHGPLVTSMADADADTLLGVRAALGNPAAVCIRARQGEVLRSGRASAPVIGGNLATLCHLLGTPFAPDFSGHILFIEDTGEKPYRIDRMLTQMDFAGCFDHICGVAAGSFADCGPQAAVVKVLEERFAGRDFPVVTGFPAGHGMPNMTLPIGMRATLDSASMTLAFSAPAGDFPAGEQASGGT